MRTFHRLKAWALRRALVRQRAENIRGIRAGRRDAKRIKVELVRQTRLAGRGKPLDLDEIKSGGWPSIWQERRLTP